MSRTSKAVDFVAKALDKSRRASAPVCAPLATAARAFGDALTWERIDELDRLGASGPRILLIGIPETEDDRRVSEYRSLSDKERSALIARLRSGALVASGRDSRQPLNSPRIDIPPDAWGFLEPQFERSAAKGPGFTIEGIEVRPPPERPAAATARMEKDLRKFVAARTKPPSSPVTRDALWNEAKDAVPGASRRAFDRAWQAVAHSDWRQPGRKQGRRIDTPD